MFTDNAVVCMFCTLGCVCFMIYLAELWLRYATGDFTPSLAILAIRLGLCYYLVK